MIVPENISSEGWDWYEENQIDWYYIDHLQSGEVKEYWNSEGLEDPRCYSEYYLHTNEEIFDVLEGRGEWFGHFYYDLDSQHYDECERGWYDPSDGLTWEEEHSLYLEELDEGCDFESSLDSWVQPMICDLKHLQGELLKHSRYKKKQKHQKDKRRTVKPVKQVRMRGCMCTTCRKSNAWNHKHLRAQKIYTEEEYFYDPSFDYDDVFGGAWWTVDPWFYEEIGYDYLVNEAWINYIDIKTGRVLNFGESNPHLKVCTLCGSEGYDWCDC